MKKFCLLIISSIVFITGHTQKKKPAVDLSKVQAAIVEEGKKLYQLQTATALGLENFLKLSADIKNKGAGYFAYKENNFFKCVFFNDAENPQIISTIIFDSSFNKARTAVTTTQRTMTNNERDLYFMRFRTLDAIQKDISFFKLYSSTSTIVLPIIENNERKVFVITKSEDPAAVVFGNDYVLDFDNYNYIAAKKAIHNDLTSIDCVKKGSNDEEDLDAITHKHEGESGDLLTATDVCAILYNQKKAGWQHQVIKSEKYVSIWNCETNEMEIVTNKKWEEFYKKQNKGKNVNNNEEDMDEKEQRENALAFTPQGKKEMKIWTYDKGLISIKATH